MKESIGYTVTINIVITFIVIVFAFIVAALVYYKSNKVGNLIINSIEKYEGYNSLAKSEILANMESLGYKKIGISCPATVRDEKDSDKKCDRVTDSVDADNGFCVYYCEYTADGNKYYYYKVRTAMTIDIPLVNDVLKLPVYSNTTVLYDFSKN